MPIPNRRVVSFFLALALLAATGAVSAQALTPTFTYQGELRLSSGPASGNHDMQFRLFNAASGGVQIGATVTVSNVVVSGGLFAVPLDFGLVQFAGERQWLEVQIRPAGSGSYETLSPRSEVTAAPYAWSAAVALANAVTTTSIVDGSIGMTDIDASQVQRRISGTCPSGQYVRIVAQDGSVNCGVDADSGGTVTSIATGAGLTGGPITSSGTIAIAPGGVGATEINTAQVQRRVSGTCPSGQYVRIVAPDGTVTCGTDADSGGTVTSIATGAGLTGGPIIGSGTITVAPGGIGTIEINDSQVQRRVTGTCTGSNYVQEVNTDGTVSCGAAPAASGWSLTGNAGTNPATDFIGTNDAQPFVVRTANAPSLRIEPSVETFGTPALPITTNTIGGSHANFVGAGVRGATIAGGGVPIGFDEPDFVREAPNRVTDAYGTVGGGYNNQAGDVAGTTTDRAFATIGGGIENTASGAYSTVGGGFGNTASGFASAVSGGIDNTASGRRSTVGGGSGNCAGGDDSWAGGFRAKVRPGTDSGAAGIGCSGAPASGDNNGDESTFVWSAAQSGDFVSTGPNQFLVRAQGGFGFNINSIPAGRLINTSTGAHLTTGGTWSNASSRAYKTDFAAVDPVDVLGEVLRLGISTWVYRDSPEGRHMGPVAEDFHALFGLGGDSASISTVDASGVALAAIQGLNAKLESERSSLAAHNAALSMESAELRDGQDRLEAENAALREGQDRLNAENAALRVKSAALLDGQQRLSSENAELRARLDRLEALLGERLTGGR